MVKNDFEVEHSHTGSSSAIHGRIELWKRWLFMRAENWSTRKKNLSQQRGEQTQPLMASTPGFEPGPHSGGIGRRGLSPATPLSLPN